MEEKSSKISLGFAWIAVLFHILFFYLESFAPEILMKKNPQDLNNTVKVLFFNQGFYNLCLALGLAFDLRRGRIGELSKFCLVFMIIAAVVLLYSSPHLYRGAIAQGLPPILALLVYYFSRK